MRTEYDADMSLVNSNIDSPGCYETADLLPRPIDGRAMVLVLVSDNIGHPPPLLPLTLSLSLVNTGRELIKLDCRRTYDE